MDAKDKVSEKAVGLERQYARYFGSCDIRQTGRLEPREQKFEIFSVYEPVKLSYALGTAK